MEQKASLWPQAQAKFFCSLYTVHSDNKRSGHCALCLVIGALCVFVTLVGQEAWDPYYSNMLMKLFPLKPFQVNQKKNKNYSESMSGVDCTLSLPF